jgi:hypothetical protein
MKFILVAFLAIACSSVGPGGYRSTGLEDRVTNSDIIAIVKIAAIDEEYKISDLISQFYSTAQVAEFIKGGRGEHTFKFITNGLTPSRNPSCCENGQTYLIFGSYGYPLLETDQNMEDYFVMEETGKFVSPADGPYSAFRIVDGYVEGWDPSNSPPRLETVVSAIRKYMN